MVVRSLLIAALEKVAFDTGKPLPVMTSKKREQLQHAKWLIKQAEEGEAVVLKALAFKAGLNEYALKQGVSSLFEVSPYGYHTRLKMEQAARFLLDTKLPVLVITNQLSYKQSSSFGHEFKKWSAKSPGSGGGAN
jgi:AraC-like DNA-binding protein